MRSTLVATVFALSMAAFTTAAQAVVSNQIGGGPIYTDANTASIYCYWVNEGTTSILPIAQHIFNSIGTDIASSLSCKNKRSVASEATCSIEASIDANPPYSCQLNFRGSTANLRGTIIGVQATGGTSEAEPLR